jgi:riboflavin-specific deaminase-like protein
VRRLLPTPVADVDPAEAYADLPRADGRPGIRVNMVVSLDGATAVGGRSGQLGGPADNRVFHLLRALTDVVLVGAGTVRVEKYGPARVPEDVAAARREAGRTPVPRIAVVSGSLQLDFEGRLFTEAHPEARPIILTAGACPSERRAAAERVAEVVVAGDERVDIGRAMTALGERGAGSVLCEGGPVLNGELAGAGMLDELCLTLAPAIVAGGSRRAVEGPELPGPPGMSLLTMLEEDGMLFLRYRSEALT